jgi:YHS domain-containing protein
MAFSYVNKKGQTYYLHSKKAGKGGKTEIYYFAKEPRENALDKVPDGFMVIESEKTALPILKKKVK